MRTELWIFKTAVLIFIAILVILSSCIGKISITPSSTPTYRETVLPDTTLTDTIAPPLETKAPIVKSILGKIIFVSQIGNWAGNDPHNRCQINIMNDDGSNLETLFESKDGIYLTSCSPEEDKIAFFTTSKGSQMWLMNADGTNPHIIANNTRDEYLCWSPDGTKIASTSRFSGSIENSYVYIINADGSNQHRLTDFNSYEHSPAWSPEGTKIACGISLPGYPPSTNIWVMNFDGSNRINLTGNLQYGEKACWSSDGTKIVFSSINIYSMNADGTNQTKLTNSSSTWDSDPIWSPDGTKIAFARSFIEFDERDLYVMNSDGSNLIKISDNPGFNQTYVWSSDSKRLAFVSERDIKAPNNKLQIDIANADGSNRLRLTDNQANNYYLSWPGKNNK
jgi:Tol biopolymer transport system component